MGFRASALKSSCRPGALVRELEQVAARQDHVLREVDRAALEQVPSGILLVVGIFRRHSIDWHDCLEAALRRAVAGADHRTLRRGAGDDDGLDALLLEPR